MVFQPRLENPPETAINTFLDIGQLASQANESAMLRIGIQNLCNGNADRRAEAPAAPYEHCLA